MKKVLVALSAAMIGVVSVVSVGTAQGAQQRQGGQGRRAQQSAETPGDPAVTPVEIQRMFDAYALVQAQDQLQLNDEQYSRFLVRFKSLQDIRRRSLQVRTRVVADLRRLLMQQPAAEAQLKDRMSELQDVESRSAADVKKAYDAIDQVLDIRQQASFRVFEEQMERRKIELITRARQANRPRPQP
jgi:hypothetical protein